MFLCEYPAKAIRSMGEWGGSPFALWRFFNEISHPVQIPDECPRRLGEAVSLLKSAGLLTGKVYLREADGSYREAHENDLSR